MKKLCIVRHGETLENVGKIIQGHIPGTLSPRGIRQVESVASRLKDEHFDIILSSDLERSRRTTEIIARGRATRIEHCSFLRERNFGEFEGKPGEEFLRARTLSDVHPLEYKPLGGESINEFHARCRQAIDYLTTVPKGSAVLISAHGGTNRCIIAHLTKANIEACWTYEQGNTCVNTFYFAESGELDRFELNCLKHLAHEELQSKAETAGTIGTR